MPDPYTSSTLENIILTVLAVLIIIISVWSIYAFFRAIFLFIFSGGNEEKIKSAWSSIRHMILWIFLTVMVLFIFPFVLKWVKLPNSENFSAEKIFGKAWELISWSFWLKEVLKESQEQNQYKWNLYYDDENIPVFYDEYDL